jgi:hypothetical protein
LKLVSDVEAKDRNSNVGLCVCGGTLKEYKSSNIDPQDTILTNLFLQGVSDGGTGGSMESSVAEAKVALNTYIAREIAEIIGEDKPVYGPQNEAGDISLEDMIAASDNDLRAEQRVRAIEKGYKV